MLKKEIHKDRQDYSLNNPDSQQPPEEPFRLKKEFLPPRLHSLLERYTFRRCTFDEIAASSDITDEGWPGMQDSRLVDLRARELINAPMCGVFADDLRLLAYTRLLWGMDNKGKPEMHSHMTAVSRDLRDSGIGEALKWLARQVALEFPDIPVHQMTVTFDNLQGRNCHINLNKLGIVCGASGGKFIRDVYENLGGEQHLGNPTDRYFGRWYLTSEWVLGHLEDRVRPFSLDEVKSFPHALTFKWFASGNGKGRPLAVPEDVHVGYDVPYISFPFPLDWDELLLADKENDYESVNFWRSTSRTVLETYHAKGYTTISQTSDLEAAINYQVLVKDFNPFDPYAHLEI